MTNEPKWMKEFDERFDHIVPSQGGFIVGKKGTQYDNCCCDLNEIKSFISQKLDEQREEIRKLLEFEKYDNTEI